jgi:dihydroorotate dehydrogenase electron transfer subunit
MKHFPAVEITRQETVTPTCRRLYFLSREISRLARPGQFVHIRIGQGLDPLLRRPLSIYDINRSAGETGLLYRIVGQGTRMLAEKKEGDFLDIIGPLGQGFTLPIPGQRVALVAGGIGIAPLFFLWREIIASVSQIKFFVGARTAGELMTVEEIQKAGGHVEVATDDGSKGYHGPVTDLLANHLARETVDIVYACGPVLMLKVIALLLEKYRVEGEFSLEGHMGCGIGACLSCVCKTKKKRDPEFQYSRVCVEGPVFRARDLYL